MGNKITDIDQLRNMAGGENRLRNAGIKKTAKLGTEKNPAVVHVQTEKRLKEVTALFKEKDWIYKIVVEPDKPEDITELERLLNPPQPMRVEKKPGRNEPCSCGSGKKYKNCCGQ